MGNPLGTQYTIHNTKTRPKKFTQYRKLKWYAAVTPSTIGESGIGTMGTQYTVWGQTNIHNTTQKTEHMSNTESNKTQENQEW